MKIVPKLTLALVGGMCVVLGINGYSRVRRETEAFEAERLRRHSLVGRSIGAAVRAAWRTDGESAALATLDETVARYGPLKARWLSAESAEPRRVDPATLARASSREPVTVIARELDPPTWFTYVPITIEDRRRGEIELSEPGTADRENARSVVVETLKTLAGMATLSAVIAFVLGHWFVGRPVKKLTESARRIGRGEFGTVIDLDSDDELAELGRDMSAMCERLAMTIDQLRHADRLATVGKLASGVAHELGTPLNVVSARAEMIIASRSSTEESRDYARAIAEAAGRMTRIISQLLQFARRKTMQRASVDLTSLVRESAELLRPLARRRGVGVELDASSVPSAIASVDAGQLQQVVTNLVMNAIQASTSGKKVVLRIVERVETPPADIGGPSRDGVCIFVEDDGVGIAPEDIPRIFEPFFTTKEVGDGTGLGLAVSYGIVRDHGGWMTVRSKLGAGTTFSVFLPRGGEP